MGMIDVGVKLALRSMTFSRSGVGSGSAVGSEGEYGRLRVVLLVSSSLTTAGSAGASIGSFSI